MSAVVALDVGSKRIGVAVSDPSESYALPLRAIERTNMRADMSAIVAIATEYGADVVVVGDPLTLSGTRGPAAEKMDAFVEKLRAAYRGAIERVDERMTTAQATKTLLAADVSRARRKHVVDAMAAALILETYLARRRNRSNAT